MQTNKTIQIVSDKKMMSHMLIKLIPFIGFLLGIMIWLVDAAVDVYIINPEEEFLESIFSDNPTEIWMRSLVVVVMTVSSIFASYLMRKQYAYEKFLLNYQTELENIVDERTKELQAFAGTDALTKIYNRYKFDSISSSEIKRAKRYQQPLALMLLDIDHFKNVNDHYGHNEGDKVLQVIADLLRKNLRQSDVYARWGGEEFIVLMCHTNLKGAENLADKIRKIISTVTYGDNKTLTASFGVSEFHIEDDINHFVDRADQALYKAKRSGRNKICSMVA